MSSIERLPNIIAQAAEGETRRPFTPEEQELMDAIQRENRDVNPSEEPSGNSDATQPVIVPSIGSPAPSIGVPAATPQGGAQQRVQMLTKRAADYASGKEDPTADAAELLKLSPDQQRIDIAIFKSIVANSRSTQDQKVGAQAILKAVSVARGQN